MTGSLSRKILFSVGFMLRLAVKEYPNLARHHCRG